MVFDERDLRLAVNHLAFDMFHFRLYVQMYEDRTHIYSHRVHYQAVIYSLLLHFRVLLHFFYGTPRQDDCCAEHFRKLPGFEAAFPPSIHARPIWEQELAKHLHKRLAHFTATRWDKNQPPMNYYAAHFKEVLELVGAFEAALPGEIGHHFSAKMDFWKQQYRNLDGTSARIVAS
jgi:hypothetical protein